jgi:hypothetical protein
VDIRGSLRRPPSAQRQTAQRCYCMGPWAASDLKRRPGRSALFRGWRATDRSPSSIIRHIKGKIEDEPDPRERRRLRRVLTSNLRKMRAYREALEVLGLAFPQLVDRQLVDQISTFLLLEDEFERNGVETRKSRN